MEVGMRLRSKNKTSVRENSVHRLIQPHILLFFFICLLYFMPLWLVSISTYAKGGVITVGEDANRVIGKISIIYMLGFFSFCLGSWSVPKLCWLLGARSTKRIDVAKCSLYISDFILLSALIAAFILSKLLLIPAGVYANYAFDAGTMDSPVWTASMLLSDAMILASIIVLFSKKRHNILLFFLIAGVNGINLLHGTRNFFVITIFVAFIYIYIRTHISIIRLSVYGALAFLSAASLGYVVYLNRSHITGAGFALLDIFSPIVFESVFSQMSLVSLLNHPILIPMIGNPIHLIKDIVVFTTPRILFESKSESVWLNQFGYLSPLGAFNGFAAGLLYFGYLFPLFYYLIGLTAGFLYRWSTNQYGAILYFYFTSDFLYRIARDGYTIPFKMVFNTMEMILAIILFRILVNITAQRIQLNRSMTGETELV